MFKPHAQNLHRFINFDARKAPYLGRRIMVTYSSKYKFTYTEGNANTLSYSIIGTTGCELNCWPGNPREIESLHTLTVCSELYVARQTFLPIPSLQIPRSKASFSLAVGIYNEANDLEQCLYFDLLWPRGLQFRLFF